MKWEFTSATEGDIRDLVSLVNSAYRGEGSRAGWTTEADLLGGQRVDEDGLKGLVGSGGDAMVLVARQEGRIVGCVELKKTDRGVYLGMLTVRPDLQGHGAGKQLLSAAETWAVRKWQAKEIWMTVIVQRQELIQWYERRGYQVQAERRPFPYGDLRFGEPLRPDLEFVVLRKLL